MPASASDIAKFTTDGIVVTSSNSAILTAHPEAVDQGDDVIEMFFDNAADALVVLNERFGLLSQINGAHEAVVVEESLGLGSTISVTSITPSFRVIDEERMLDTTLRTRAYAYEAGSDQYSVELMA